MAGESFGAATSALAYSVIRRLSGVLWLFGVRPFLGAQSSKSQDFSDGIRLNGMWPQLLAASLQPTPNANA
jgi:hypothetical protein